MSRFVYRLKPRRDASALVIVLACIVMLSILIVSFLVSMQLDRQATANFTNAVKAEQIARAAFEEIIGDLRREIDAGSWQDNQPVGAVYTVGGVRVYTPKNGKAAMPARIGFPLADYQNATNALSPAVIRVSRASDPFFANPPSFYDATKLALNRASAVSTTNRSKNGRLFPADRWNATYLLGTNAVTSLPNGFRTNAPDWVYVSKAGGRSFTNAAGLALSADPGATNQVLGRYAFVVYDQGGLLDVNAAGFPSSAYSETNATNLALVGAAAIRSKTYSAYADLTKLPGLSAQASAIDALINWRSKGLVATNGGKFIPGVIASATNGFLQFTAGDNPLLSRQDLIEYFRKTPALTNSLAALSCLSTFGRNITAPSWTPATPTNSIISPIPVDYAANAEKSTFFNPAETADGTANSPNPNRNLANLRIQNPGGRTHYRDDGSTTSYSVATGDSLLRQRFSLARIAWLAGSPITGPSDNSKITAIRDCFGLRWGSDDMGKPCWIYDHGDSGRILTLAEVAQVGREPDFFELLKAGILSGSLGKNPGVGSAVVGWDEGTMYFSGNPRGFIGTAGYGFEEAMASPDFHILQIGANIIDQFDADGFPTAIHLDVFPSDGTAARGPLNTVYGQENLPAVTRMFSLNYEHEIGKLGGWYQPELWNVNQAPPSNPANRPSNFRMTMYGKAYVHWEQQDDSTLAMTPRPSWAPWRGNDGTPVVYTGTEPESHIYFNDSGGPASAFYAKPVLLTVNNGGYHTTAGSPNAWKSSTYFPTATGNPYVGFYLGAADYGQGDGTAPGGVFTPQANVRSNVQNIIYLGATGTTRTFVKAWNNPEGAVTFALEYSPDGGTTYLPYSWTSRVRGHYYNNGPLPQRNRIPGGLDGWPTMARTSLDNEIHSLTQYAAPGTGAVPAEERWPWGDTFHSKADPRTDRFSVGHNQLGGANYSVNSTVFQFDWNDLRNRGASFARAMPRPDGIGSEQASPPNGFFYPNITNWNFWGGIYGSDWAVNVTGLGNVPPASFCVAYYSDADGVVRPGDAFRANPNLVGAQAGAGDGDMLWWRDKTGTDLSQNARRPLILDRPFRSIGELGYVFRDLPFKSLDFSSKDSADSALLDLFSVSNEEVIVAGQVNPNTAPAPVLTAILSGAALKDRDSTNNLSATDALAVSTAMASYFLTNNPVLNRANLVTERAGGGSLSDTIFNAISTSAGRGNKSCNEAPIRALAGVSQMRTWNLLVDVVAQSGRFLPHVTDLKEFTVEGEKRFWLHISIDRFTGKVVEQQIEPVYE